MSCRVAPTTFWPLALQGHHRPGNGATALPCLAAVRGSAVATRYDCDYTFRGTIDLNRGFAPEALPCPAADR